MDTQKKKTIRNLVAVIQRVREEHGDIPVQMLETLLVSALHPDVSQGELQDLTNQSKAAASRNIRAWTNWTRHHQPGPAYIEAVPDPYETRRKLVRLTRQGDKYVNELADMLAK